ncbi:magnesium transporter [Archaeoglobus profundus]|uniref:MgtE integral membrane region n=1 Tax=Archaeoglobus profundus (strain DSM 5631 / JCM 9629 / NBRC 100127 / Av18) TaxID=572546 RepID=D2RDV4_ARCPA|nr:magnesium transporter [Archaeoglobus profundus]ADB58298.1 MgtE integral membrane region [Archaeoglobus profundus DSM 5631]
MRVEFGGFKDAWKVTFPALLLCLIFDFVGGTFLGGYFEKLMVSYPLILVVLPGIMGLRGNIYGALASRFTTSLFLGEMKPSLRDKKVFEGLILGITLSLLPVILLWFVGFIKVGRNALEVLAILLSSTIFVSILLSYATAVVSVIPFRKGVDPDAVASPLVTSIADLLTIPMLIAFIIFFEVDRGLFYIVLVALIFTFLVLLLKFRLDKRAFFELSTILVILAIVEGISGGILESYSEYIYKTFILSILYPAVLDSLGNYGCVIGSKTSTRLHLGEIDKLFDIRSASDIVSLLSTSIPLSVIMYSLGYMISINLGKSVNINYAFFLLYPIVVLVVMFLGYLLAFVSYRFGLDPDNVTVPTITTLADLIGTTFTVLIALW